MAANTHPQTAILCGALQQHLGGGGGGVAYTLSSGMMNTGTRLLRGNAFISKLRFIVHNRELQNPTNNKLEVRLIGGFLPCVPFAEKEIWSIYHTYPK